jgi:hybrid cluster-associated redox disulfide protein
MFKMIIGGKKMAITKDMIIRDIVTKNPKAAEILMAYGMGCVGCPSAQMETLEEAAVVHAMNIDELITALNK